MIIRGLWLLVLARRHGLGGALAELGLPQTEIPVALFFFQRGCRNGSIIICAGVFIINLDVSSR
jgi:hypothetical protein